MKQFIENKRSLIVALDVPTIDRCIDVVRATAKIPEVGAYKIGFELAFEGLDIVADTICSEYNRINTGRIPRLIYDHQKAGTDIPDTGVAFAKKLHHAGIDCAILFPFAGPATQSAWTKACQDQRLRVMIGVVMTHPQFLENEGGYIAQNAPERIFDQAAAEGVRDFVIPGTKPHIVDRALTVLKSVPDCTFSSPGFFKQGGDVRAFSQLIGDRPFYPIVGREIYAKETVEDMRRATQRIVEQL